MTAEIKLSVHRRTGRVTEWGRGRGDRVGEGGGKGQQLQKSFGNFRAENANDSSKSARQ